MTKNIVVSAVNIRKGGTLTILRSCLAYLSGEAGTGRLKVTAIVHRRSLCDFPGISYIEMPECIRNWGRRLWAEYVTMHRLSRRIAGRGEEIDLWLSLHDTTPRVTARRQAVYCQTSFPFYRWRWRDFRMDFKIPLFAMLTRYAYRINVHRNDYLIVQQQWLRDGLSRMLGLEPRRFIVSPPERNEEVPDITPRRFSLPTFFYASTPDCHKNFELLAQAAALLEQEIGPNRFQVVITVSGHENRYARWLRKNWGDVMSLRFEGLMDRHTLFATYAGCQCFVFPSRIETWGLPISECMTFGRPMLLADLPYARETAAGAPMTAFFDPDNAVQLKDMMRRVIDRDPTLFKPAEAIADTETCRSWNGLFSQLLQ